LLVLRTTQLEDGRARERAKSQMVRRLKVRLAAAEARIVELSKNDDIMHIERSVGGRYLTPQGAVAIALRRNLGNCACAFRDETLDSQYVQYSPCISLHDMHLHYLLFMVAPNDVESTLNHVERRCYMLVELLVVTPQPLVEPVSLQPRWTSLVVVAKVQTWVWSCLTTCPNGQLHGRK
jgi:hypothetical protein